MSSESTSNSEAASSTTPEDIDPRLVLVRREPLNCETPLTEQIGLITPNHLFYIRTNFPIPRIAAPDWRLTIEGEVERPAQLTYEDLRSLPSRSLLVTLECAGNGRSYLDPKADGEQWQYGAVSTAEWTGVPLGTVLAAAGLTARAREVVIEGADGGKVANVGHPISFARSLSVEKALDADVLLAYAMNGEVLPPEHGFPVRLLVSGWYGMASVKWVTRIRVIPDRFDGYYQAQRYIMAHPERGESTVVPLTNMRVRSLIVDPSGGATLLRGEHRIRGYAWSGAAPITRVEVSVDGGRHWSEVELVSPPERYGWRRWEFSWQATTPGSATLQSRAFDAANNAQPTEPEWNRLGYANNAIQVVKVAVE